MKIDNAILIAAGTSSRFAPISYEKHKALIDVRGEILIERQIEQIREAGIQEIIVVVGYMAEKFMYLKDKYDVTIVHNPEYLSRNNNGSIYAARNYLKNSYICATDIYYKMNPFEREADHSFYSVVYSEGYTDEWCVSEDEEGYINRVTIGGISSWYMMGIAFWNEEFCTKFIEILEHIYNQEETRGYYWEDILIRHLDELKMKVRRYQSNVIYEFDSLDELRRFDKSYINDSRSRILKNIAEQLTVREGELINILPYTNKNTMADGFCFEAKGQQYEYSYKDRTIKVLK